MMLKWITTTVICAFVITLVLVSAFTNELAWPRSIWIFIGFIACGIGIWAIWSGIGEDK
jgi:NO-binding membrane sensor protein with MHYT domain